MRKSLVSSLLLVAGAFLMAAQGAKQPAKTQSAAPSGIVISPVVPADIPGGAHNATLAAAAQFAWQEFIALNWPALANSRDTPNTALKFGQTGYTGPLVWQTYRHKVETFPGRGNPPGYSNTPPTYGYNAPPQYIYGAGVSASGNGQVGACPGQSPVSQPAWVNLDENSQIGLDQMYAGAAATSPVPGQQILFLAKGNEVEYAYVAANQWFGQVPPPFTATASYVTTNKKDPPPGSTQYVSFPSGTIEVKTAWRRLTSKETASGRFLTGTIRFYETTTGTPSYPCYREEQWGMVALHIIQKTPTAPYFVFATFGQTDNMLDPQGNDIEDPNGVLLKNQQAPPLNPTIVSKNATSANPATSSSAQALSPQTVTCTAAQQLYYQNIASGGGTGLPAGQVCIQRRKHDIPPTIITANTAAHAAITAYDQGNGIANSPWLYYKLVNVQYKPINKVPGKDYTGPDAATFYQANIVVETDYNLQVFSGRFQQQPPKKGAPPNGCVNTLGFDLITDFNCNGTPFYNTYFNGTANNMGGCMGCHGNAQVGGADFSFILDGQRVAAPESAGPAGAVAARKRFAAIFRKDWPTKP
jgi:hypothetical protein